MQPHFHSLNDYYLAILKQRIFSTQVREIEVEIIGEDEKSITDFKVSLFN